MLLWRRAFQFPTAEAGAIAKLWRLGLWLLLCPPVGWLFALGYRKEVAFRIGDGVEPVLPDAHLRWGTFLDGCKAAGVIVLHLCPMWALYWLLAVDDLNVAFTHWRTIARYLALCSAVSFR